MAKTCSKCGTEYQDEMVAFSKDPQTRDGLYPWCRTCKRAKANAHYHANVEDGRAQRRAWYQRNRERRKAETLAYRRAHPEQHVAQVKRWMKANPDKVRKWARVARHNRTARKRGGDGAITAREVAQLFAAQSGLCFWCDTGISAAMAHLDHVVPLLLSGPHSIQNVVLSCQDCNQRKHAKHPAEFNAERWERFQRERSAA